MEKDTTNGQLLPVELLEILIHGTFLTPMR